MASETDVNHDGYLDLLLYFRTEDLQLTPSSTEAVLYGTTYSGQRIRGSDSVRVIVPPARLGREERTSPPGRLRRPDW